MGPEFNHKGPYKGEAKKKKVQTYQEKKVILRWSRDRYEDAVFTSEWRGLQPKNASSHQELEEARNGFSPRTSGGNTALLSP